MTERPRARRPHPKRTAPIRDWTGLYRAPPPAWGPIGDERPADDPPGERAAPPNPVAFGVEQGYRVIDAYLRQGRQWAAAIAGSPPFAGVVPPAAFGAFPPGAGVPLAERAFRDAAELLSFWMAQWASALPVAGAVSAGAPLGAANVPVTVEVTSPRPARVQVTLREARAALACQPLQPAGGDAPAIDAVGFGAAQDGTPLFRVRIGADQPPGTYLGVVFDRASGEPLGTASVLLPEDDE